MKTKSLIVSVVLAALALLSAPALAQSKGDAKRNDIKKLMALTGAGNLGVQAMQQMIGSLKVAIPNVKEQFWQEFMKEVSPDELVSLILPIYDKHLTHEEIKELIKFYETPVGKKMIMVMPAITQESMQVGQQWGMDLANRAKKKLQAQQGQHQ